MRYKAYNIQTNSDCLPQGNRISNRYVNACNSQYYDNIVRHVFLACGRSVCTVKFLVPQQRVITTINENLSKILTYARDRLLTNTQLGCVVGVGCLFLLLFLNCEVKVKLMNINFTTYFIILTTLIVVISVSDTICG